MEFCRTKKKTNRKSAASSAPKTNHAIVDGSHDNAKMLEDLFGELLEVDDNGCNMWEEADAIIDAADVDSASEMDYEPTSDSDNPDDAQYIPAIPPPAIPPPLLVTPANCISCDARSCSELFELLPEFSCISRTWQIIHTSQDGVKTPLGKVRPLSKDSDSLKADCWVHKGQSCKHSLRFDKDAKYTLIDAQLTKWLIAGTTMSYEEHDKSKELLALETKKLSAN